MLRTLLTAAFLVMPLSASITVSLTSSVSSPQLVGTTITWTATGSDTSPGTLDYRFSVSPKGGAYQILQDFDVSNAFEWTPSTREGTYNIQVIARNITTRTTATMVVPFTATPRVTVNGGQPVVSATPNPLVALYSAPGCPSGSTIRVRFGSGTNVRRTSALNCLPTASANFYVAGMLPNATYSMNYEVVTGTQVVSGPLQNFTTGAIDPSLVFPPTSVPLTGATDTQQSLLLVNACTLSGPPYYFPFAVNLTGQVIWYYPRLGTSAQPVCYNLRPVTGGTVMMMINDPTRPQGDQQIFREIDLAGNTIRQTSATAVSRQLQALGRASINSFSHDMIRLPNGHTLLIGSQERMYPAGTQGSTAPVDILGNAIVDLDSNLQLAWSWSAFDHLDITRPAVLGETCRANIVGCPPLFLAPVANDWIHGNSLNYVPSDGSILFSSRHQDWVYKLDYGSGSGTGDVIWRLGLDGDFTMTTTSDPYPWFSHQHDVEFELGGTTLLSLYDNGNTRIAANPGEDSRGQALTIDQTAMTASVTVNVDMGVFSVAVGSAQLLDNGSYHFDSGWIPTGPSTATAQSVEVQPNGIFNWEFTDATLTYRSYRMSSLYSLP